MAQSRTKNGGGGSPTRSARRSNGTKTAARTGANGARRTRSAAAKTTAPKAASPTPESADESSFAEVVSKAKTPLLAGGAAAAGLVGGIAISRTNSKKGGSLSKVAGRRKSVMPKVTMPKPSLPKVGKSRTATKALGATAKALGNTAAEIGKAGYRVGELTTEMRRVREQAQAKD